MRALQVLLVGGAFWAIAAVASAACDCTTPPCTGNALSQRSASMGGLSAGSCDGCDASGVATLGMEFNCNGGACTCGRYVTGDYWILDPSPSASATGVQVTNVTPAYRTGRNGMGANPVDDRDPFDSRSGWYNASENILPPYVANAGQSLIKGVSLEPNDGNCDRGNAVGSNSVCMHSYFVVTVVGQTPPSDAYRPPYYGSTKPTTTWRDSQINWNLVPSFNVTSLSGAPSLSSMYERIRSPQVDHWPAKGGYLQQILGLTNTGSGGANYGGDIGVTRSDALCRALGPEPIASGSPSRRDVLRGFVQNGIDAYWIMKTEGLNSDPSNTVRWMFAGGHGAGRKPGPAIAATLLNDRDMRQMLIDSVADETATGDHFFNEDGIVWRSPRTGRALLGEICPGHSTGTASSNAQTWWNGSGICRDPDGLIDGGDHSSGLPPGYSYGYGAPASGAGIFGWLFPQVKVVWAHDPFFEVADRWFGYELIPGDMDGNPGGVWADDDCTNQTPSSFSPYSGCVRGTGRMCGGRTCESYHGAGGRGTDVYRSRFCENVWATYRTCAADRSQAGCSGYQGLFCGDTVCTAGETATSCAADCAAGGGGTDTQPPSAPLLLE